MAQSQGEAFDVLSSAWLRHASDASRTELGRFLEFRTVPGGTTIYALGGPQEWLWGLVSGQVQVRLTLNEMELVLAHVHHPGAWFGESELIQGTDGIVEMRSVGKTTLAKIPYARFRTLANARPDLWESFALLASMNQLLAMSAANDLALRTGRKRIAATLLRLSGRRGVLQGSWCSDVVNATQQEIANLANLSISKVSEHLAAMAKDGLLFIEYGRIRVLDPDRLSEVIVG